MCAEGEERNQQESKKIKNNSFSSYSHFHSLFYKRRIKRVKNKVKKS